MRGVGPATPAARQTGVALAIVVWFIAGMSLLSAGIVMSARMDSSLARIHLSNAQATAAADGAINLFMADLSEGRFARGGTAALPQERYRVGDTWVAVAAIPVELLLDANNATAESWVIALQHAGSAATGNAAALADAIVQWRDATTGGAGRRRFESLEDLLSVEGLDRAGWDRLRDYVTVHPGARNDSRDVRGGNSMQRTMRILDEAVPARRASLEAQRVPLASQRAAQDGAEVEARVYRVDAMLMLGDRSWLRRRWVSLSGRGGELPWRSLRIEAARMVSPQRRGRA